MFIPPRIPRSSQPEPGVRAWWPLLVVLTLIIVPVSAHYIYETNSAIGLHREADTMMGMVAAEYEKLPPLKDGIKEELNKLTAMLLRPENYENPDFLDYIEGHQEELAEITDALQNAKENLEEAETYLYGALAGQGRSALDVAETAIKIARKKIAEARELLSSYKGAI